MLSPTAAMSRPRAKALPSPTAATSAVALMLPIPGHRRQRHRTHGLLFRFSHGLPGKPFPALQSAHDKGGIGLRP